MIVHLSTGESLTAEGGTKTQATNKNNCKDICLFVFSSKSVFNNIVAYHWQELSQVSFLSQQKFCRDKTRVLSRQKYACRDKSCVAIFLDFFLSRQNICHGNHFS